MSKMIVARRGLSVLALASTLAGCESLLDVKNPEAILEPQLVDRGLADVLVNSALGALQGAFNTWTYHSAILSDEAVTGHNFPEWRDIDMRMYKTDDGVLDANFEDAHLTRFMADSMTNVLKSVLTAPAQDLRVARTLVI